MIAASRKTRLALEAVIDIALHARPDPVQSRDVTARLGVPQRYLEQSLQHLVRAGVLKGVRGPKGGYALARERRKITAAEIVRALEGAEDEDPPVHGVARALWEAAEAAMLDALETQTLESLCARAKSRPSSPPVGDADFVI